VWYIALTLFAAWYVLSIINQFTNRYGKWVRQRLNTFGVIPGWTFFAPTPGTSDYHFVVRDLVCNTYSDWVEIEWCTPRRFREAIWHPSRHRAKLVVDCVNALMLTIKEMKAVGLNVEEEPQRWMVSLPYLALLNIVVSVPPTVPGVTARQFAIIEQKGGEPLANPKLLVCSPPHELSQ
jgi:hypothetical protein